VRKPIKSLGVLLSEGIDVALLGPQKGVIKARPALSQPLSLVCALNSVGLVIWVAFLLLLPGMAHMAIDVFLA
jgi:hypothetical protein